MNRKTIENSKYWNFLNENFYNMVAIREEVKTDLPSTKELGHYL